MNPRQTYFLAALAFLLMGFIYFFERHQPGSDERKLPPKLFPTLEARQIEALEVTYPASGGITRAEQEDGEWTLVIPRYPAQQTALDNLGLTLEQLRRLEEIPAHELLVQGPKGFGFDPPQATLRVESGTNNYILQIGATTPLTTNLYVKLENSGQVFVTDGRLLHALPGSTNAWRSPRLVELKEVEFDHIRIQAGNRLVELEQNETNDLWQIARPIPARADQNRVNALLQALAGAQASRFVADGVSGELERFGLQSPAIELSLLQQSNEVFRLEFGAAATNAPGQLFVRRANTTNVVLADKRLAELLAQPYKTFHDPRLLTFQPEALDRIRVDSVEDFTLQRQAEGGWMITEPVRLKADEVLMNYFITNLADLKILDLAKEVPTEQDLAMLGILRPVASYALFEQRRNTDGGLSNIVVTEIAFGTNRADTIYVKRSDETPVYVTRLSDMLVLPRHVFEIRDRQLWSFSPSNIVSLAISTNQESTTFKPDANGVWSTDPIQNAAREEMLYRLGQVEAMAWVAKGGGLERFGITPDSLRLQITVRHDGAEKTYDLHFGYSYRGGIYTAAILPGDEVPTVFLFPSILYEEILGYFPPS